MALEAGYSAEDALGAEGANTTSVATHAGHLRQVAAATHVVVICTEADYGWVDLRVCWLVLDWTGSEQMKAIGDYYVTMLMSCSMAGEAEAAVQTPVEYVPESAEIRTTMADALSTSHSAVPEQQQHWPAGLKHVAFGRRHCGDNCRGRGQAKRDGNGCW